MRVAVISDIHANLPALEATAEAIERESPDEIWCLGDLVGYGAAAERVLRAGRSRTRASLPGRQPRPRRARRRSSWTTSPATPPSPRSWTRDGRSMPTRAPTCRRSARAGSRDGVGLYHASPRDPVWEYVLTWEAARDAIHDSGTDVVARRPQPRPAGDRRTATQAAPAGTRPGGTEIDLAGGRWLLNPGSVGQPRDGDPRRGVAAARPRRADGRVPARRPTTSRARRQTIRDAGLPDALAERLAHGV